VHFKQSVFCAVGVLTKLTTTCELIGCFFTFVFETDVFLFVALLLLLYGLDYFNLVGIS